VAMCSKAILALLVYGIIMHCSVYCSPAAGLQYPALRDGHRHRRRRLPGLPHPAAAGSRASPLIPGLFPPPRHADGIFNKAYRKLLGQLSARKYLHSLMAKRVG
ncbi:PACA protein, partial [Arenaria interpres]|nr:PACA protein [Arenaria interpres]